MSALDIECTRNANISVNILGLQDSVQCLASKQHWEAVACLRQGASLPVLSRHIQFYVVQARQRSECNGPACSSDGAQVADSCCCVSLQITPEKYLQRCAIVSPSGEECVLTFNVVLQEALECQ